MGMVTVVQKGRRQVVTDTFGRPFLDVPMAERRRCVTGYHLRHVIKGIVRGITAKEIQHYYGGSGAATNEHMMLLPRLPQSWLFTIREQHTILGYTVHEICHQLYTAFGIMDRIFPGREEPGFKPTKRQKHVKAFWNAIEDYRIEKICRHDYPGFPLWIDVTRDHTGRKFLERVANGEYTPANLSNPFFLGAVAVTWAAADLNRYRTTAPGLALAAINPKLRAWVESWTDDLSKVLVISDSLELAERMVDDLYRQMEDQKNESLDDSSESDPSLQQSDPKDEDKSQPEKPEKSEKDEDEDDQTPEPDSADDTVAEEEEDSASEEDEDQHSSAEEETEGADSADADETETETESEAEDQDQAEASSDEAEQQEGSDEEPSPSDDATDDPSESDDVDQRRDDAADENAPEDAGEDSDQEGGQADADADTDSEGEDATDDGDGKSDAPDASSQGDPSDQQCDEDGEQEDGVSSSQDEDGGSAGGDAEDDDAEDDDAEDSDGEQAEDQNGASVEGDVQGGAGATSEDGASDPAPPEDLSDRDLDLNDDDGDDGDDEAQQSAPRPKLELDEDDDEEDPEAADLDIDDIRQKLEQVNDPEAEDADIVEPKDIAPGVDREKIAAQGAQRFAEIRATLGGPSLRSAGIVRRMLQSRNTTRISRGREEGDLDFERVVGMALGESTVYRQMTKKIQVNTAISLLLDNSASMTGDPLRVCQQTAIVLDQAVAGTKTAIEIVGFTSHFSTGQTRLYQYRTFDQKGVASAASLGNMTDVRLGGTPVAVPLYDTIRRLTPRPEERKLVIVVSDGAAEDPEEAANARAIAESMGCTVVGISIGTDQHLALMRQWCRIAHGIATVEELPQALTRIVQEMLR